MNNSIYKPVYHDSWAIVIGINQYQKASVLSYACNDADSVRSALTDKLGFDREHVLTLKDSEATKNRILDEFINLHKKAAHPDDRVMFFFAGHGYTFQANRRPVGYLVPVEGDTANLNTLIRWDDITGNAELIPAKHIFFVMDACYSGLAMQRGVTSGIKRFVSDSLQRPARQVLTAGKADETVSDGGGPSSRNSIFTGYLIKGIDGDALNEEGVLTANSLMCYVYEKVGQDAASKQTPAYGHIEGDGDFILLVPGQEHLKSVLNSDYLVETVGEAPDIVVPTALEISQKSFAATRGYNDPEHANFGRNDLSSKLGESRITGSTRTIERAFSWLGLIIEPTANQLVSLEISDKASKGHREWIADGPDPWNKFVVPPNQRTTFNSLLYFHDWDNQEKLRRYLRIYKSGCIEYADVQKVFLEANGIRLFKLVQIIGLTWQLLFLAKRILQEAGYNSGVRLTFSLVGSRGTALANFSQETGEKNMRWNDPLIDPSDYRTFPIIKNVRILI